MEASGSLNTLSDVDYLVARARIAAKSDQYGAKAWLMTARSLFPGSFKIQFESYLLEKSAKNVDGAYRLLETMYANFPMESEFWVEVQSMLDALQSDSSDPKVLFLTEVFARLPTSTQCQMLLSVADNIKNVLDQCRLLLLAMKKFPNLIAQHGLKLVEMLYKEETQAQVTSTVNSYRRLLVCQVLPVVLQRKSHVGMSVPELIRSLQTGIEFYVTYIMLTSCSESSLLPEVASPTLKMGGAEREGQIVDPWNRMFRLVLLVAPRLGWDVEPDLFSKSRDSQWQYLLKAYSHCKQRSNDTYLKQALYVGIVIFLQCLHLYIIHVDTEGLSAGAAGSHQPPVVLLEGLRPEEPAEPSPAKRPHMAGVSPKLTASPAIANSQTLIQDFLMAFKCFELLNSTDEFRREFVMLCQHFRMKRWLSMTLFQIDLLIYQGMFKESLGHITTLLSGSQLAGRVKLQMRLQLQSTCCNFCLGKPKDGCRSILSLMETMMSLPVTAEAEGNEAVSYSSSESGRHLLLLQCTQSEVFPYCIQLLIACLKEKALSPQGSDLALGHLMVLLQHNWNQEEKLFFAIIERIKQKGSFTYNSFFSYIHDMLEELAFLDYGDGSVTLDIMPVSTKTLTQQRTVTRGVNKGVKEDFRAMLERQARMEPEPVEQVLRNFLQEEKESLLQLL